MRDDPSLSPPSRQLPAFSRESVFSPGRDGKREAEGRGRPWGTIRGVSSVKVTCPLGRGKQLGFPQVEGATLRTSPTAPSPPGLEESDSRGSATRGRPRSVLRSEPED